MVVPEGGSLFEHNMTMVVDGHTAIEHTIPVANIYADVAALWPRGRASATRRRCSSATAASGARTTGTSRQRLGEPAPARSSCRAFVLDPRSRRRIMAPRTSSTTSTLREDRQRAREGRRLVNTAPTASARASASLGALDARAGRPDAARGAALRDRQRREVPRHGPRHRARSRPASSPTSSSSTATRSQDIRQSREGASTRWSTAASTTPPR